MAQDSTPGPDVYLHAVQARDQYSAEVVGKTLVL